MRARSLDDVDARRWWSRSILHPSSAEDFSGLIQNSICILLGIAYNLIRRDKLIIKEISKSKRSRTMKRIIAKTIKKTIATYNNTQARAWGNARFRILLLSVASYVALC